MVVCLGEPHTVYELGESGPYLTDLLQALLPDQLTGALGLAYEPLWAIGTGKTPTLKEIDRTVTLLQSALSQKVPQGFVVYGGSVSPKNAQEILALESLDGVLIGKAGQDPNFIAQLAGTP